MSGILSGAGVLITAGAASAAIVLPRGRARSLAMLSALALCPALILGDQWHTSQIADLRDDPARLFALGALALALTAGLAFAFRRWPLVFPLAAVAALPFRVPLEAGGDTANLLVPLYLVIAGGVVATGVRDLTASSAGGRGGGGSRTTLPAAPPSPPDRTRGDAVTWLTRILAAVVLLYAVQTLYSPDFSKSLQSVCFFFVPFSLLFALLRDVEWSRKLLRWTLLVLAVEAVAFVLVGSVEWLTRELFWNDQVIRSNDFHTYFRVNSVFWDPNIYGRWLALAAVIAMAVLLWTRERRSFWLLTGLIAVLWIGLVPTYSQSSFAALLGGLAVLAALRWSWRWTLAAVGTGAILALLIVVFAGGVSKLSPDRCNVDTGGRCKLVAGGVQLFEQRPLWGYGSGSFPKAYTEHIRAEPPVSVSHTQPITVAAEQGLIGITLYAALLVTALWTMLTGMREWMPGLSVPPAGGRGGGGSRTTRPAAPPSPPDRTRRPELLGRAAVLAAFAALIVHTMAYAGFYEDPIAWVLLAVGASLAAGPVRDGT